MIRVGLTHVAFGSGEPKMAIITLTSRWVSCKDPGSLACSKDIPVDVRITGFAPYCNTSPTDNALSILTSSVLLSKVTLGTGQFPY